MQPCLSELLRTAHAPPSLLLRIEKVVATAVANSNEAEAATNLSRIYLSDNELVIQALVSPRLQLHVAEGDLLEIKEFEVKKARRKRLPGHIVFLAVYDCEMVERAANLPVSDAEEAGGLLHNTVTASSSDRHSKKRKLSTSSTTLPPPSRQPATTQTTEDGEEEESSSMDIPSGTQSSDDFESTVPDPATAQKRRAMLHNLDKSTSSYFGQTPSKPAPRFVPPTPSPVVPTVQITDLASLPVLSPSTPVNVLVAISWIGQSLLRPSPAFPYKRHAKLHDLSVGSFFSGVSLAVYIEAKDFNPDRGTIALLQGVVVQRCGPGIGEVHESHMLNAYANLPAKLKEKGIETPWLITDRSALEEMGLDEKVEQLEEWWEEREMKRLVA
jgi:hypothetical protein